VTVYLTLIQTERYTNETITLFVGKPVNCFHLILNYVKLQPFILKRFYTLTSAVRFTHNHKIFAVKHYKLKPRLPRTKLFQDNYALLCYYAASSGTFLTTFRDNQSIPSSGLKNQKKKSLQPQYGVHIGRSVGCEKCQQCG
jgi:hypothetical protein